MSQYAMADRLATTQSWISKCERGERRLDVVELRQFCVAMGVEADVFMQRLEEAIQRGQGNNAQL